MSKFSRFISMAVATMALGACSGETDAPESDNVTETQMDEVDVIDGTISDDMVDLDTQQSTDAMEEEEKSADGEDADKASDVDESAAQDEE